MVIALVIVAVIVFFVVRSGDKKLSHTAVEKYIAAHFNTSGVTCNNGNDVT